MKISDRPSKDKFVGKFVSHLPYKKGKQVLFVDGDKEYVAIFNRKLQELVEDNINKESVLNVVGKIKRDDEDKDIEIQTIKVEKIYV